MKLLAILTAAALSGAPQVLEVDKADGRSDGVRVVVRADANTSVSENKAWLGVSLGNVPESLATQLNVDGGVLILNVVEDSPADLAGFEPHDIVVSIDGEIMGNEVGDTVRAIGKRQPGEPVNFLVLRDGREQVISATLGDRPDNAPRTFSWKVNTLPDAEVEDQIRTRGHFMFQGPEGNWVMRDLGDLEDVDLPHDVNMFLPQSGSRNVQVFVENGEKRLRVKVQRDGETIEIDRDGDGPITVTRTDESGNVTTATYDSEDDLAANDEEAYDLFAGDGAGGVYRIELDGLGDNLFHFNFDSDDMLQWHADAGEGVDEGLQAARDAHRAAMEHLKELHLDADNNLPRGFFGDGHGVFKFQAKPRQTFEVRADGTIEVRVRKGDSELVKIYADESDLRRHDPKAYEKYLELMEIEE